MNFSTVYFKCILIITTGTFSFRVAIVWLRLTRYDGRAATNWSILTMFTKHFSKYKQKLERFIVIRLAVCVTVHHFSTTM